MLNRNTQVESEAIADQQKISSMEKALAAYIELQQSGAQLEEADWSKIMGLEFREALAKRDELASQLGFFSIDDDDFSTSVITQSFRPWCPADIRCVA